MGTQEKQVEKILQKENLQKTTFQNLESSLEFFGFSESVNTLVDSFCVRLSEGESASVFSLCFHRLHHIRMYLLFFFFMSVNHILHRIISSRANGAFSFSSSRCSSLAGIGRGFK